MLFTDWVVLILLLTMIVFPTQIIYFIALLFFRIKERNPEMAFYQKDLVEKLDDIKREPSMVKDHFSCAVIFLRVSGIIFLVVGYLVIYG